MDGGWCLTWGLQDKSASNKAAEVVGIYMEPRGGGRHFSYLTGLLLVNYNFRFCVLGFCCV